MGGEVCKISVHPQENKKPSRKLGSSLSLLREARTKEKYNFMIPQNAPFRQRLSDTHAKFKAMDSLVEIQIKNPQTTATKRLLGNTANISAAGDNLARKYALLDHAKLLLSSVDSRNRGGKRPHRTRVCHAFLAHGQDKIVLRLNGNASESRATYGGLQTCGSIWACPVCASRVAAEKAEFILKTIQWAKHNDKKPMMMTLTARHNRYMPLEFLEEKIKAAWEMFTAHWQWKKLKKQLGIVHWLANSEIPFGENGWHNHKHILLLVDFGKMQEAAETAETEKQLNPDAKTPEQELEALWIHCLATHGLEALPDIALKITASGDVGNTYLTKIGITVSQSDGKLELEMTASDRKDSKTVWQLLESSYYGNARAGELYLEYVQHMTGKKFITTSHGLGDLVAAEELAAAEVSEAAEAAEEPKMKEWAEISPYWWDSVVRPARLMGKVLRVAAKTRDVDAVRNLLWQTQEELIQCGELGDYHRNYRHRAETSWDFAEGIRRIG